MNKCSAEIHWSDGTVTICNQDLVGKDEYECYHHAKYFDIYTDSLGVDHYLSGPADIDRNLREQEEESVENEMYITEVVSPNRNGYIRKVGKRGEEDIPTFGKVVSR